MTHPASELYLISPLDVSGAFPDRLVRALDAGPVAAFQFRVKDVDTQRGFRRYFWKAAPIEDGRS